MKKLIIMAGLPASGKSTYIKNNLSNLEIVDCDEIKKGLEGYDPLQPEKVHALSKVHEKQAIYNNLVNGMTFVYDTTATNSDNVVALTLEAQSLGYSVEIHYIRVSLATSIIRNSNRERVVPKEIILDKFTKIEASMKICKNFVDYFIEIDGE